jgi:hypothetical protein
MNSQTYQQVNNNGNILQGQVSRISTGSVTWGNINQGRGTISSANTYSFVVGNTPASLMTKQNLNIDTGDLVTAVGNMKNGTYEVTALRNESTGAVVVPTSELYIITGAFFTLIGIVFSILIIGLLLLPFGIWLLYLGFKNSKATSLLRSTTPYSQQYSQKNNNVNNSAYISSGETNKTPKNEVFNNNITDELEKLFKMKNDGVISDEEYKILKANVLKN